MKVPRFAAVSFLWDFSLARSARRGDILINFTPGVTATSCTQATTLNVPMPPQAPAPFGANLRPLFLPQEDR